MFEYGILHQCSGKHDLSELAKLYWCLDCKALKCIKCTTDEIVCVYCPSCLFEVPSASIKNERANCGRNCFKCPICVAPLQVVTDNGTKHFLDCLNCGWDSLEIGMHFERPTGLSAQMQKNDQNRPDLVEFLNLKAYYDKMFRHYKSRTTPTSSFLSRTVGALGFLSTNKIKPSGPFEDYKRSEIENQDRHIVDPKLDLETATALQQKLMQVSGGCHVSTASGLKPLRVPLNTKRLRKCRECQNVLVKPDAKALSVEFPIKSMAW